MERQGAHMIRFCGQEKCLIDSNGRVKLSPRFLQDFRCEGDEVVLHCLPEGALGVYPMATWTQMRQSEGRPAAKAAQSVVFRRQLRRFGALTQQATITRQGRITIPAPFRALTELDPGLEAYLVGCEIGVEIWNTTTWKQEMEALREHELRRAGAEMEADLDAAGNLTRNES